MQGILRDLVWRSLWDQESYNTIRRLYIESCSDIPAESEQVFQNLPAEVPHRFSAVLDLLVSAIMCGIERLKVSGDIGESVKTYLLGLKNDLLKLYSDLVLEEREYMVPLRPHRIERLLNILATMS